MYYLEVCKYYMLRVLVTVLDRLSERPAAPDTRDAFARLVGKLVAIRPENRPTTFALEQAYIEIPKEGIVLVTIRPSETLHIAPPYTLWLFKKLCPQCSDDLAKAFIHFRRTLGSEPESRQIEYMGELTKVMNDPNSYIQS